ncbi:signal peptidase II [Candidatus Kinetoplastibacterium desouzaii TCC079E]|uniref:Lipoprotein signal peptidase n=1 Tax=Candidatus Kinetoplastidibacterium desouzai TCC079E TaxID=1208919 RepID=M1LRM4_9PROT|nr:signal peptidase II [Candidatus Kinetoplastibacterium desouzaii]AGF46786.1 signal peptidase II [Candidatus Kinetoplastibacterium desouzaii TCC079E]
MVKKLYNPRGNYLRKYCLFIAFILIIVDQYTKSYLDQTIKYAERINIYSFFDLTIIYNWGAAFSILSNQNGWERYFFIVIGCFVCLVILKQFIYKQATNIILFLSLTTILAGTIGNMIDRIINGYVIDFLLFYYNDFFFPAFNFADVYISFGTILLILSEVVNKKR